MPIRSTDLDDIRCRLKVTSYRPKPGSHLCYGPIAGRLIMPAPDVRSVSTDAIDHYQAHRKQTLSRLGMPGLLLIGIGTLLGLLHGPTPFGVSTGLVGFAMIVVFGIKVKCPACGATTINRWTSWNPDTCSTCGARLKR